MSDDDKYLGITVNATRGQIEEFKESVLWADIVRELDFWSEGFSIESDNIVDRISGENLTSAAALTLIGSIDGRKRAVSYFKQILDVFLSILNSEEDEEESSDD